MFLSQFQQQQNNIYIGLDLNKTTPICRNILFSTNRVHYKIVVKNESDSKIYADYKSHDRVTETFPVFPAYVLNLALTFFKQA